MNPDRRVASASDAWIETVTRSACVYHSSPTSLTGRWERSSPAQTTCCHRLHLSSTFQALPAGGSE
jgi:hypothetical protein